MISLRASTEVGSFCLFCSSAMANMWTSSLQLDFNLSWPFPLSPTNLNFSPGRFKTLGPANWGNRRNRKNMSLALLVLCESVSWIVVVQLVSTFTQHKLGLCLLLGNASVFHSKQSVEQGLEITFHNQLSIRSPLLLYVSTKLC